MGAHDQHYVLIAAPTGLVTTPFAPFVVSTNGVDNYPFGDWLPDYDDTLWISPQTNYLNSTQDPEGAYVYRTQFYVPPVSDTALASLQFELLADNAVTDVVLNGSSTGIEWFSLDTWSDPFTICTGFVVGTNTLDFVVRNDPPSGGNPTGLRVLVTNLVYVVAPALRIYGPSNQTVRLEWDRTNSASYQLQTCSTLVPNSWTYSGSPISGTGGPTSVVDSIVNITNKFYRVKVSAPDCP